MKTILSAVVVTLVFLCFLLLWNSNSTVHQLNKKVDSIATQMSNQLVELQKPFWADWGKKKEK